MNKGITVLLFLGICSLQGMEKCFVSKEIKDTATIERLQRLVAYFTQVYQSKSAEEQAVINRRVNEVKEALKVLRVH